MSRTSSLWAAGAVALLFALIIGAVILRPVLSVNADGNEENANPGLVTTDGNPSGWDDDDDDWESEGDDSWEDEGEDHEDEEYEDDDGEHDDDD